jgi:hypothetical protein
MAVPGLALGSTILFFGTAVVPRTLAGFGWRFKVLVGFHKLYSRVLLRAAAGGLA